MEFTGICRYKHSNATLECPSCNGFSRECRNYWAKDKTEMVKYGTLLCDAAKYFTEIMFPEREILFQELNADERDLFISLLPDPWTTHELNAKRFGVG